MAENWVQSMNRCTGPEPCHCPITGPHQDDNAACPRNVLAAVLARRRKANASGQNGEDAAHILAAAAAGVPAPSGRCASCGLPNGCPEYCWCGPQGAGNAEYASWFPIAASGVLAVDGQTVSPTGTE